MGNQVLGLLNELLKGMPVPAEYVTDQLFIRMLPFRLLVHWVIRPVMAYKVANIFLFAPDMKYIINFQCALTDQIIG